MDDTVIHLPFIVLLTAEHEAFLADTSYIIKIETSRQADENRTGVWWGQQLGMTLMVPK